MANKLSNEFLYQRDLAYFTGGTFTMALMAAGFAFDPDIHLNWSDISANELAGGSGYTSGGQNLAGVQVTKDNANNRNDVTWTSVTWTAAGGTIGPSPGAVIRRNTGVASTSTIVGFLDFLGNLSAAAGVPFVVLNPTVRTPSA